MLGQSKGWQQNLLYFLEILYNVWVDTFFSLVIVQVCRAWLWLKMFTFRNKISIRDPEKIDQKIAMHGKITASAQKWPSCLSFASVEPLPLCQTCKMQPWLHQYATDRGKLGQRGCAAEGCKKAVMVTECKVGRGLKWHLTMATLATSMPGISYIGG